LLRLGTRPEYMNCRHCNSLLKLPFVDLGSAPPSNAYLTADGLSAPEIWYPLRVVVCEHCWLVQTADIAKADQLFDADYSYFSSYSSSWLQHAERYVAAVVERFKLSAHSRVVEVAANDGYLLQYVQCRGIPCTGVEPTASTAGAARAKGIPIVEDFFSVSVAESLVAEGGQADLTVANNVLAHVPDINDFVGGFRRLLRPHGVATFEFPHLLRLIAETQFDTIYHEHFSYLSLTAVTRIFHANGLDVFDVEELPTHGGSLRIYAKHKNDFSKEISPAVARLVKKESDAGLLSAETYREFGLKVAATKRNLLQFLIIVKNEGKKIAGYGAPAKGNTLLNYCGIRSDYLDYTVDANPHKQNLYLPGTHIPIRHPDQIREDKPDYILILPWNIKEEIMEQLSYTRDWGCHFIIPIPTVMVI